jgi:hypothetical protein
LLEPGPEPEPADEEDEPSVMMGDFELVVGELFDESEVGYQTTMIRREVEE